MQKKEDFLLFLENVMIREMGLYVLMGSKPMCTFSYSYGLPETDEEFNHYYKTVKKLDHPLIKNPTYEDLKTYYVFHFLPHMHYKRLWKAFKDKMDGRFDTNRYLFVIRKAPFGKQNPHGLFINVPYTLFLLKEHYQDFANVGGDFNPERILQEISNNDSEFWEKVFQNHYLQGLLFGYGAKNAFLYSWLDSHHLNHYKTKFFTSPYYNKEYRKKNFEILKTNITVQDLILPPMSQSLYDEVLEKFHREREEILKKFKGKDFATVVMEWLEKKES